MKTRAGRRWAALACAALLVAGCGGGGGSAGPGAPGQPPVDPDRAGAVGTTAVQLSAPAQLGQFMFKDPSLSASGRLSCASCHDPARGHASPLDTPVALGGPSMDQQGLRNPPALDYLRFNGPFTIAGAPGGRPQGGFFWDGRADTLAQQARAPLLNAREMANADAAMVVAKLAATPYAPQFRAAFGDAILTQPEAALDRMAFALQQYQLEDPEFAAFTSKFDAWMAGRVQLTPQELNGLDLFNRPDKGNCAACHPSTKPPNAPGALFTDFGYDNLGVPRNRQLAANGEGAFFDGGLCGVGAGMMSALARSDLAARSDLCGAFRVPSLRNVALRRHFFHNGVFGSLEQVIYFYARRDSDPQLWYPMDAAGSVVQYDDVPAPLRANVTAGGPPYSRPGSATPTLSTSEVVDIARFLRTLTDGFGGQ